MKIYMVEELIDSCAWETRCICMTEEIAEREKEKIKKKNKYEILEIRKVNLIEK